MGHWQSEKIISGDRVGLAPEDCGGIVPPFEIIQAAFLLFDRFNPWSFSLVSYQMYRNVPAASYQEEEKLLPQTLRLGKNLSFSGSQMGKRSLFSRKRDCCLGWRWAGLGQWDGTRWWCPWWASSSKSNRFNHFLEGISLEDPSSQAICLWGKISGSDVISLMWEIKPRSWRRIISNRLLATHHYQFVMREGSGSDL